MSVSDTNFLSIWRNPLALSFKIFWRVYPVHAAGIYIKNLPLDKSFIESFARATISPLAGAIILLVARTIILRRNVKITAGFTVGTYLLMGVADGVTSRTIADGLAVTPSSLIAGSFLSFQILLLLFTIFASISNNLTSLSESRIWGTELLNILQKREQQTNTRLAEEADSLKAIIANQIQPLLIRIQAGVDKFHLQIRGGVGGELFHVAQLIREESIPLIRETSHRLTDKKSSSHLGLRVMRLPDRLNPSQFSSFLKKLIFNLRPPSFFITTLLIIFLLTVAPTVCQPRKVILVLFMAFILTTANLLYQFKYFQVAARGAILLLLSGLSIILFWIEVYFTPIYVCSDDSRETEIIFAALIMSIGLIGSGLYSQILDDRIEYDSLVRDEIAIIKARIGENEDQIRSMRGLAGNVLHGPILGRLSSIVLALTDFTDRNEMDKPGKIEELQQKIIPLIQAANEELDLIGQGDPRPSKTMEENLKQVIEYWSGLIAIDHTMTDLVQQFYEVVRPQLDLAEITQELITNANRHANARNVKIEIDLVMPENISTSAQIKISCRDDGASSSKIARKNRGIGLRPIIEVGGDWKISPLSPNGNLVEIEFPYFTQK